MELGKGEAFDTFPNMFPDEQYLRDSEIKHGRQAMLAWTGVWATSTVSFVNVAGCVTFFRSIFFSNHLPNLSWFIL